MPPHPAATFDRFAPANVHNPYPLYQRIRDSGPFLDPTLDMWIVAGYDDVRTVLGDHERFSSAFNIRTPQVVPPQVAAVLATGHPEVHILLNQDPPEHTAVREKVAGAFTPRRARALTPTVQRLTEELIDRFTDAGQAELIGALAWPLPLQVICELLGLPASDATQIRAWIDALTELTSYGTPLPAQVAAAHQSVAFERYLAEFIAERRTRPRDDLTSDLLNPTNPRLTDTQTISLLINLVFAGHETTASLIGNTLLNILPGGPGPQAPAGADPGIDVDAAVEETLRRDPPVQGMFRSTGADAVDLGGTTIPAGSMVFALIGAANRDPAAYADPDAFDTDRLGPPQLAFGRGVHFCLGAAIAKMEAQVAINALLARLPDLRLAPEFIPPYLPNLIHRGPRRLEVHFGS